MFHGAMPRGFPGLDPRLPSDPFLFSLSFLYKSLFLKGLDTDKDLFSF